MASDLARAVAALVELDRLTRTTTANRQRLRTATEVIGAALLARLRVGTEVTVGEAVYAIAQVTWPSDGREGGSTAFDSHGVRALLRNDCVLVAGDRKHNAIRVKHLPPQIVRAPVAGPVVWDLRHASDTDRVAFAREQAALIETLGLAVAAEGRLLDEAASTSIVHAIDLLASLPAATTDAQRHQRGD